MTSCGRSVIREGNLRFKDDRQATKGKGNMVIAEEVKSLVTACRLTSNNIALTLSMECFFSSSGTSLTRNGNNLIAAGDNVSS